MKKKQILFFACCLALGSSTMDLCAQRTMDKLGRGLVALSPKAEVETS